MKNNTTDKDTTAADSAMLLDESPTPAPHALIRLQERPVFQKDDKMGSFAMMNDLDYIGDKIQAYDEPLTIRESKPD